MDGLKKEWVYVKSVAKFSDGLEELANQWAKAKVDERKSIKDRSIEMTITKNKRIDKETGELYHEVIVEYKGDDLEILPEEDKV